MLLLPSSLPGLMLFMPQVFRDERGQFQETYNKKVLKEEFGLEEEFVQDNESFSKKGTLRGLHFQYPPHAQGKLVRVVQGKVLDVAVDIRPSSPTFGKHFSVELTEDNHLMLYLPPGFAHGFLALTDAIFSYKCTALYNKESEGALRWNDPELGIAWGEDLPLVSEKDQAAPSFGQVKASLAPFSQTQ